MAVTKYNQRTKRDKDESIIKVTTKRSRLY